MLYKIAKFFGYIVWWGVSFVLTIAAFVVLASWSIEDWIEDFNEKS